MLPQVQLRARQGTGSTSGRTGSPLVSTPASCLAGSLRHFQAPSEGIKQSTKRRDHLQARAQAVSTQPQATAVESAFRDTKAGRITDDKKCFVEEYRIRGCEAGPDQKATLVTMANILQEVAGNHAVALWGRADNGFATIPELKNKIFVMSRLQINMEQYPKWGDIIRLDTFFAEDGRLLVRRDWRVSDARTGAYLGCGTSSWVTIDTETRKLAKLSPVFRVKYEPFSPGPDACHVPFTRSKRRLPDMDMPPKFQGISQVARRSDVDMNSHINNVTYLAWTLETVPEAIYSDYILNEVEIDFKAECHAGDTVEPLGNPIENATNGCTAQFLHSLRRCDDDGCRELVRARTSWSKKALNA